MTTPKTILGFGASSMQGVKDSQGGFLKRLDTRLNHDAKKYNVINLGIGGNTTRDMLARIDTVEPHKPDCTIILLGCNDMPRDSDGEPERARKISLDEYGRNLEAIFTRLRSPRNIFITSFYVRLINRDLFASYMETARNLAVGYEIWDLFQDSLTLPASYYAPDQVHFNDEGHEYLCNQLLKILAV